ncbi:MAG: hypothetical protein ACREM6_11210, partial [Vulcanimicrobiaceae bacterium]
AGGGGGGKGGSAPQGVVPTPPPTTPPPTSALAVSPMTMTFSSPNAGSQTFAISGGAPPYSATCSTPAATVTISGNAGTVTPKAAGQCTITVSDSAGRSQTITVVVDAALQTTPAQLSFSDPDAPPQTASISGGTQPYALSGGNCAAGSFTLSGSTITVSPTTLPPNAGCTVGFKDQAGNAGSLPVFVGAFGTLNVTPMMLTFTSTAAPPQTITIAKGNPPFSTSGCTGIVTTTPSSPTTFSVTPVAGPISPLGVSCNLAVSDSVSPSSNVSVKVDGPLTLMPSPLKLGNPSSTGMVAMSGGTGAGYTSTAQSGQCTFSVSGTQLNVAAGATPQDGSCTTRVTDSANNEATLMVSVGKYPTVSLSKGSLAFSTPASPDQTVDVTSGIGPFTASGCTGGATTTVNGTTIKVTPIAPTGGCTVTVTDTTSNNTATFTVTVDAFPALTLDKSALTFPTPTSPVQIVTVTSGTGPYTASGCSGNATPGVSGSKITVTPNAATTTSCSITVTDTASGKTAPISVIVSAPITFLTHPLILTGLSGTDTIGGGNRAYGSTPASTGGCLPSVNGTTLTVLVGATLPGKVCSVTVSDTANPANTGTLNVCNGSCPAGTMLKRQSLASSQAPLSVLPSELISFTSPQDAPVSLTVSTPANAGLVTASSSNQTIAVVGLGKAHNEFTVAPGAGGHGSATVTFTDSAGHRVGIIVSESFGTAHGQPPAGASAASPGASANIAPRAPVAPRLGQSLVTLQPGITSRVTIAEENYAGEYTITGANPAIATVMLNGSGANAALLVQARATGACTVIVRDAAGRQTTLLIRVQAGGLRQAQPAARRPN